MPGGGMPMPLMQGGGMPMPLMQGGGMPMLMLFMQGGRMPMPGTGMPIPGGAPAYGPPYMVRAKARGKQPQM